MNAYLFVHALSTSIYKDTYIQKYIHRNIYTYTHIYKNLYKYVYVSALEGFKRFKVLSSYNQTTLVRLKAPLNLTSQAVVGHFVCIYVNMYASMHIYMFK